MIQLEHIFRLTRRRSFASCAAVVSFAAFLSAVAALSGAAGVSERPNILLILCDDLGFSDLGCYGGEIATPRLDQLAAEGIRFTQFYNCAVCVTTRAALLTGLYPRHVRDKSKRIGPGMITVGEALKNAGYATALVGKWHLGSAAPFRPIDRGFEEYYGLLAGCCNFFNPAKQDPIFYNGGRFRPFAHNDKPITDFPAGFYTTDAFSDHAADLIRNYAKGERPFFLHLCYTAPHFPLHAFPEDIAKYRGKYSDGYGALRRKRHQRQRELGLFDPQPALSPPDRKRGNYRYDYDVPDWRKLSEKDRRREEERMEVYAAMVERMDRGIGRVLDALQESGSAENTVVFFLSDNGGCASWPRDETGFLDYNREIPVGDSRGYEFVGKGWGWAQNAPFRRFKTWTYEGGIATPMIVRWPGKAKPGRISSRLGHVIDFMPTLLEIAGGTEGVVDTNSGRGILPFEGANLVPVFMDEKESVSNHLCWELYGNRAIRKGDWKLVWGASVAKWELYNLREDRSETINLVKEFPARVRSMANEWETWAAHVGIDEFK